MEGIHHPSLGVERRMVDDEATVTASDRAHTGSV